MAWSYNEETGIYSVSFSELPDLLNTLEQNTRDTPYKLDVTGVTADDLGSSGTTGTFGYYIRNTSLFIDLSPTTLPALSFMTESFSYCATLVKAPDVAGAYMRYTFFRSGIEVTPTITCTSEIFQSLEGCFAECTHLKHAIAPASLSSYGDSFFHTFHGCTALEDITFTKTPDTSSGSDGVLADCTSLRLISVSNSSMQTSMKNFLTSQQANNSFPSTINVNSVVLLTTYDVDTDTYTVPFSELATLLNNLPQNTVDTPYKLNITNVSANQLVGSIIPATGIYSASALGEEIKSGDRYVDLSPTTLPNATNIKACFYNCTKVVIPPSLPSNATDMSYCFYGCSSLTEPPIIPATNPRLDYCFIDCTSLEVAPSINSQYVIDTFQGCTNLKTVPLLGTNVRSLGACFTGCTSLERIEKFYTTSYSMTNTIFEGCDNLQAICVNGYNSSQRTTLVNNLNTYKNAGHFPSDITPADIVFYGYTEGYSIAFSNLNNYLMYLEPNTVDNPYKLTVTGLSVANVNTSTTSGSLGYVIAHNTKYLDLSLTSLHASQTTMKERFNECTYLVVSPNIPNNVTDMEACYGGCHNLKTPPTLSTKTTNMKDCFVYCRSLESAPVIPNTVTTLHGTFYGCTSLEEPPEIPDSVTIMGGTFFGCTSLAEAPVIPDSVYELSSCFYGCTSLDKAPIIPSSVTTMADTFVGCTNLEIAPIIPSRVENMENCFKDCTSLVDVPSVPSLLPGLALHSTLETAFDGCSALKRVNFNEIFDLYSTDFDSVFNDCNDLESIFVKSSANRTALITYLESQQNDGKFPSGLNVSEIVKFDEKTMRVQTEEGTEIVDLYRFKGQLLTEKNGELVYADEDFKPFSVQIDNETFFAQTIPESLLATCRNKGSGTVLKKMVGTEIVEGVTTPIYQWYAKTAGTLEEPFKKKYTELDDYDTDASNIVIPKERFPRGGVLLLCGGAGESTTAGSGGNGQIKRIEIPANPKNDITFSVSFTKTAVDGTQVSNSASGYKSQAIPGCSGSNCVSYTATATSTAGGIGGRNCSVSIVKDGITETVIAYGGGGAGGAETSISYYLDHYGTTCRSLQTLKSGEGVGGASGNGNLGDGATGGDAETTGTYDTNILTTAKLVIGAYN